MSQVKTFAVLASISFAAGTLGAWSGSQVVVQRPDILKPAPEPPPAPPPPATLITGANLGFKIVRFEGDNIVGQWVGRVDHNSPWLKLVVEK